MDKNIKILIQRAIDGDLSETEQKKLNRLLEQNPDLQEAYLEMAGLRDALDSLAAVPPPPNLKHDIMGQVREHAVEKQLSVGPQLSILERLRQWFQPSYGYSFALGAVAGAIVIFLATISPSTIGTNPEAISGTMLNHAETSDTLLVHKEELKMPQWFASPSVYQFKNDILVDIPVAARHNSFVQCAFSPANVSIHSLDFGRFSVDSSHISIEKTELWLQGNSHIQIYFKRLTNSPVQLAMTFASQGEKRLITIELPPSKH